MHFKNNIFKIVFVFASCALYGQSLDSFIASTLEKHPDLKFYSEEIKGMEQIAKAESALPPTMFGIGPFISGAETRVGVQRLQLSAQQKLPWFGTLNSKEELERAKIGLIELDRENRIRQLKLEVSMIYFELIKDKMQLKVLNDTKDYLESYEKLALTSLENNQSSMIDVLKIQMKCDDLVNQITILEDKIDIQESNLCTFSGWDKRESIVTPINFDDWILLDKINEGDYGNHPMVRKLNHNKELLYKEEKVLKAQDKPSLSVGLNYIIVDERTDLNPVDNGKDIIMPMFGLSIPVFSSKSSKKRKSIEYRENALDLKKEALLLQLEMEVRNLELGKESLIKTMETLFLKKDKLLKTINLSQATYETASLDFKDLLDLQIELLQVEIEIISKEFDWVNLFAKETYLKKSDKNN